jgi:hypothetical protein
MIFNRTNPRNTLHNVMCRGWTNTSGSEMRHGPDDMIHDLWNELLQLPVVWDNLIEIPGRADEHTMDPMLVYFHSLDRAMTNGFELDPLKVEESVPF